VSVVLGPCSQEFCTVYLEGPLRLPVDRDFRSHVRSLLRRGDRAIVVDLARVSRIDAAGVGELVRAYNMTLARNGLLRIVHATDWVREVLTRAGLFELLSADMESQVVKTRRIQSH
jgi:anti-anti-sigma factor